MTRSLRLAMCFAGFISATAYAQAPPAAPGGPPPTAKAAAPIDVTGNWVSVVTEDWRWRMVTPPKGDYASVPLNPEGRKMGDTWDPAKVEAAGNACASYGAAAISRVPGRMRISWQDDNNLKVEYDAGTQTRNFMFGPTAKAPAGEQGWQGFNKGEWEIVGGGRAGPVRGGSLKVTTTNLKAGFLRKNGVPYSANATVIENWDLPPKEPNGDQWLIVTTIVDDPTYLNQQFITSSHFKKEANAAKFAPSACAAK
jgi:hypothetical protein